MKTTSLLCILLLLTTIFNFSCIDTSLNTDITFSEIQRVNSKDKKVYAVMVTVDAGATTAEPVQVFIVRYGLKVSKDSLVNAVFIADHYSKVALSWVDNKKLLISYDKARIFSYSNFWQNQNVENFKYVVEIFLDCKSKDHQLNVHDLNP